MTPLSPTHLPHPTPAPNHCSVKAYSTFCIRKEKETRHRKEQAENNSQWFSKPNIICFIYLVAWWYVMFLLSLHFNMNKLFLHCLITEFNYWHNKGKGTSSLKHKQEPRKQNQIEELKGRLREKGTIRWAKNIPKNSQWKSSKQWSLRTSKTCNPWSHMMGIHNQTVVKQISSSNGRISTTVS